MSQSVHVLFAVTAPAFISPPLCEGSNWYPDREYQMELVESKAQTARYENDRSLRVTSNRHVLEHVCPPFARAGYAVL
jgi:hypothetical protein